jgi:hypothetical protein
LRAGFDSLRDRRPAVIVFPLHAWPPIGDHDQQIIRVNLRIAIGIRSALFRRWRARAPAVDHRDQIIHIHSAAAVDIARSADRLALIEDAVIVAVDAGSAAAAGPTTMKPSQTRALVFIGRSWCMEFLLCRLSTDGAGGDQFSGKYDERERLGRAK